MTDAELLDEAHRIICELDALEGDCDMEPEEDNDGDAEASAQPLTLAPNRAHTKRHGRKRPYSEAEITRLPCIICGAPAFTTWQICADGNLHRPICAEHDVELNAMVLRWAQDPAAETKIAQYRADMEAKTNARD